MICIFPLSFPSFVIISPSCFCMYLKDYVLYIFLLETVWMPSIHEMCSDFENFTQERESLENRKKKSSQHIISIHEKNIGQCKK